MIENVKPSLPIPHDPAQSFFKKPIIVVLALTVLAAIVGYAVRSLWGRIQIHQTPEDLYSDGMTEYRKGLYLEASKTFKRALARNPDPELQVNIRAARAECYRYRGYERIDKWDKALSDYYEVGRSQTKDAQLLLSLHVGRADIYSRQQNYNDAILECNLALKVEGLSPKEKAKMLMIKGFNLYSLKLFPAALQCFDDAQSHPSDCVIEAEILFFRAQTYLATQELDKAFEDLNQAQNLEQDGLNFRSVYKELAQNYAKISDDSKVMECYHFALECVPISPTNQADILVHRGCYQRDKKEPSIGLAWADFKKAFELDLKVDPDLEANIHWMHGLLCLEQNNDKFASDKLKDAIKLRPTNKILPRILLALGQVFFKANRFKEAIKKYTQGIYLCLDGETKAILLFHRCEAYVSSRKPKTGIRDCKKALKCEFENHELREQIQSRLKTLGNMT